MTGTPIAARPLTPLERSIVRKLLSIDFPGAPELRAQLDHTQVVATWGVGSPSIYLHVAEEAPVAAVADGELPVAGEVADAQGGVTGFITLWAEAGLLYALEYAWHTDNRPAMLPDPAAVSVSRFK